MSYWAHGRADRQAGEGVLLRTVIVILKATHSGWKVKLQSEFRDSTSIQKLVQTSQPDETRLSEERTPIAVQINRGMAGLCLIVLVTWTFDGGYEMQAQLCMVVVEPVACFV